MGFCNPGKQIADTQRGRTGKYRYCLFYDIYHAFLLPYLAFHQPYLAFHQSIRFIVQTLSPLFFVQIKIIQSTPALRCTLNGYSDCQRTVFTYRNIRDDRILPVAPAIDFRFLRKLLRAVICKNIHLCIAARITAL